MYINCLNYLEGLNILFKDCFGPKSINSNHFYPIFFLKEKNVIIVELSYISLCLMFTTNFYNYDFRTMKYTYYITQ